MYNPKHFEETDVGVLHALIGSHSLGTWATLDAGALLMNHVPFMVDPSRGEFGTLVGHVARANPVWQRCSQSVESIVAFQGPEIYITPSWYPSKREHGKVVPTWNYAVVHAHGIPKVIEDKAGIHAIVSALTNRNESNRTLPWKVTDAPVDYIDSMLGAIIGIEIPISRLIGKWKVSQNRPTSERKGVVDGLTETGSAETLAMAQLVNNRR